MACKCHTCNIDLTNKTMTSSLSVILLKKHSYPSCSGLPGVISAVHHMCQVEYEEAYTKHANPVDAIYAILV